MPVGVFKSQQLAVWLFSDVADDLHIFAFQFISGKFDILHLKHNPCFTRNDFTFALRSFQDGKRCLAQIELYPVAINGFYLKPYIAIEFFRPLQITDINPTGIYFLIFILIVFFFRTQCKPCHAMRRCLRIPCRCIERSVFSGNYIFLLPLQSHYFRPDFLRNGCYNFFRGFL